MARRSSRSVSKAAVSRTDIVVSGQRMQAAYRVPALQPKTQGQWTREYDKLAWIDPATGLPCIMRRMTGGFLAGFVGVPRGHRLFGWSAEAVPAQRVRAHGGIDYAQPCDSRGPEETSICHVRTDAVEHDDDAWWLGFFCDKIEDIVPDHDAHADEATRLGIVQTYKDARYVVERCTDFARDIAVAGEAA